MNIIRFILAAIGLIFVGMLFLWVLGFLSTILWYLFWIGVLGALGYGGIGFSARSRTRRSGLEQTRASEQAWIFP